MTLPALPALRSPLADVPRAFAVPTHDVWREIAPEFTPSDFRRPFEMDVAFLRWLSGVRRAAGVPMILTSDARDPEAGIGAPRSAHNERPARAIDGQVRASWRGVPGSEQLARIYIAAVQAGCVRFGTYASTRGGGDIYHLDLSDELPSPRWWTKW